MTPEQARELLNEYINGHILLWDMFQLPEHDVIVSQYQDRNVISQFSFRYLLKIAYNLQDK